jgi:hypothetical protein
MSKSPEDAMASMIAGLEEKTGRSLQEWTKAVRKAGPQKHGEIVAWLKGQGVGHGYANLIAHKTLGSDAVSRASEGGEDLVATQYAGKKAALKPIYDALIAKVGAFGADVDVAPKNAYVSLRRSRQFALIQPSTATRVDVGLNLKGAPAKGRLEASGSFNSMCTHRVRVETASQVDAELVGWLKKAYDLA